MLPPTTRRELDACGIGFVADAEGRPSRAIVAAALRGLACVKHRGAVAADARTADGSGLLVPIPAALFGEGAGVAVLFVRGDDPRGRGRGGADRRGPAPRRLARARRSTRPRSATWPVPPRPAIVHVLFAGDASAADSEAERRALRLRRRIEATTEGTYVASCSFRTMVYKGLSPADALADFYLDLHDDALRGAVRHLPPALLHQHPVDVGAGPAVPHALPQRRDQRAVGQRAPHARPRRARHRRGRPRRRGPVPPGARRGRLRLGHARRHRRAADAGGPRPRATSWRCSCPRRGRTSATSTPRSAASTATTRR